MEISEAKEDFYKTSSKWINFDGSWGKKGNSPWKDEFI